MATRKRRDRYLADEEVEYDDGTVTRGAVTELEPVDIEGSVSRARAIELDPIDIVGSRSADVEPFPGEGRSGRDASGRSRMVPDWVPQFVLDAVGQPVEDERTGETGYEFPVWSTQQLAGSEGGMPTSALGAVGQVLLNAAFPPYAAYRQFTGVDPTQDARTFNPNAAAAGLAETGAVPLNAAARLAGADNFVGLFDEDAGREWESNMRYAQRENPGSFAVGEVAAEVPQVLIPGMAQGRGATMATRAGYGALEGALWGGAEGLARSDADTYGGRLLDAVPGAVVGGVLGGGLAARGLRNERRAQDPVDTAAVERALDQAALERLGQSGGSQSLSSRRMRMVAPGATPREQTASARRTVARMHEYGAFAGTLPPTPEVINQRVARQQDRSRVSMDNISSRMEDEIIDPAPILDHLRGRAESLESIPGAETEAARVRTLLGMFQERVNQSDMSMRDLQKWKTHYGERWDQNSAAVSERETGGVYRAITGNMQTGVDAVDPALGRQYQQARHDDFIGQGFDEMNGSLAMDAARLRKVSLSDYLTGLEGFRNGGLLRGLAGIAVNRGLRRNEHGLSAMRLERQARRLQSAPQRYGQWASRLQVAQRRGPQAFAAAIYTAAQSDAAVRETLAEDERESGMAQQGDAEREERRRTIAESAGVEEYTGSDDDLLGFVPEAPVFDSEDDADLFRFDTEDGL